MACGVEPLVGVVEREGNVDRGAPDQQPVRVDETARGKRTVIGLQAALDDAGQERRSVERSGGAARARSPGPGSRPPAPRLPPARGRAADRPRALRVLCEASRARAEAPARGVALTPGRRYPPSAAARRGQRLSDGARGTRGYRLRLDGSPRALVDRPGAGEQDVR